MEPIKVIWGDGTPIEAVWTEPVSQDAISGSRIEQDTVALVTAPAGEITLRESCWTTTEW